MSELYHAEMEAARNDAVDAYFEPRPQADHLSNRALFKAGFERGFKKLWDENQELRTNLADVSAHGVQS